MPEYLLSDCAEEHGLCWDSNAADMRRKLICHILLSNCLDGEGARCAQSRRSHDTVFLHDDVCYSILERCLLSTEDEFPTSHLLLLCESIGFPLQTGTNDHCELLHDLCFFLELDTGKSTAEQQFDHVRSELGALFSCISTDKLRASIMQLTDVAVSRMCIGHGLLVASLAPLRQRQSLVYHFLTGGCLRSCNSGHLCQGTQSSFKYASDIVSFIVGTLESAGRAVFHKADFYFL